MSSASRAKLRFAAALSTDANSSVAVDRVCGEALSHLDTRPDFAVVFTSQHHADFLPELGARICQAIGCENLIGCTGESIVGNDREVEENPAVSIWLASLPGTSVRTMHLQFKQNQEGGSFVGWPSELPEPWPADAAMLLLGEPFSFPADELIRRLNEDRSGVPVLGGMASGGAGPGENKLVLGRNVFEDGAVAAILSGGVRLRSVVSQGCRPIGQPFIVTKAEGNVIFELSGIAAMTRLQEVYETLSERERLLVRHGVHVGRVLSEYQDKFERGDFLVRNVIGADPRLGAIAVGDFFRVGQTVQFHIRDEQTADDDLQELLNRAKDVKSNAHGALLFTCNGRGTRLFSTPNHDAGLVSAAFGGLPLAGFFAQGEIGPVGGKNFLHGFTASIALFESGEAE
jgi:small ligand-binding sensory domain FIST